jgi:DNA invertase Pin-like site-specific DNA recombinase
VSLQTVSSCRAIGLIRVSTDKQAESGLGLEAQQASITACAGRLHLPLATVYLEGSRTTGTSGSLAIANRPILLAARCESPTAFERRCIPAGCVAPPSNIPDILGRHALPAGRLAVLGATPDFHHGLLEAIAALKRGDVLLVAKRDRIGRDAIAVAMIERLVTKRGARIVSAAGEGSDADGPSDVLMRRLIDSFAEYERLIIGARTKHALAAKRRRGERTSRFAPYGYAINPDGRTLDTSDGEQRTLAIMRARRVEGCSLQGIADYLNRLGLPTRGGAPWRFQYVRSILRRSVAA